MARMSPFSSPLLLGFDRLEDMLDRLTRSQAEGYPPYNVVHVGEERLRISLAVAGFDGERPGGHASSATSCTSGAGRRRTTAPSTCTAGIAARQFHRTFLLADGIEVDRRPSRQRVASHRAQPPHRARDREDRFAITGAGGARERLGDA